MFSDCAPRSAPFQRSARQLQACPVCIVSYRIVSCTDTSPAWSHRAPPTDPSGETLSGVSHAGLWLTCDTSNAASTTPPAPGASINAVANSTIAASIADVKRDLNFVRLRDVPANGCSGTTFTDLNGQDYGRLLLALRALTLSFLALGLVKLLSLILGQCCRLVRGTQPAPKEGAKQRRGGALCCCLSCGGPCGGTASLVNVLQAACGWAAFGIALYILIQTADHAPVGHRSVQHLWGWSFWLWLAAVVSSNAGGGALCCV